MRPLIIDDAARARAAEIVAHAEAHPYRPGMPSPGDDPRFVAHLNTYRAVFTFTHANDLIYRHLSVSIPAKPGSDKPYPGPEAVFVIADLFGFTGFDEDKLEPPADWNFRPHPEERCVVVAQIVGPMPGVTRQ